jgi:pimeloyl-ACP methyl ester carboxylesterase
MAGSESPPASPTPATAPYGLGRGYHADTIVEGRPYDVITIASDPIGFLDALGEGDAILIGHDWGASIVYGAATLHPDVDIPQGPLCVVLAGNYLSDSVDHRRPDAPTRRAEVAGVGGDV